MVKSRIEFEVETLIEEYEGLVSYREIDVTDGASEVYVVSINYEDIDWEKRSVNYIHIENIDYIYYISGGEESAIERCYDLFKSIEKEVVEIIK